MSTIDDFKEKATEALEQAKPAVEGAMGAGKEKAAEFVEKADEWAGEPHPGFEKAYNAAGVAAESLLDKAAGAADAAYEFIKDRAEEATGKDVDGDGQVGGTGAAEGDVKAGVEIAAEKAAHVAGAAVGAFANAAQNVAERLSKKGEE